MQLARSQDTSMTSKCLIPFVKASEKAMPQTPKRLEDQNNLGIADKVRNRRKDGGLVASPECRLPFEAATS
jgi:hypothetical protein